MGYQGARRIRPGADARQAPWPPDDPGQAGQGPGQPNGTGTGPQQVIGSGTGGYRILGSGSGPQQVLGSGSGPQQVLGSGSGPQQVLGSGSSPQQVLGSGSSPQQVLDSGSSPQPTLARTPVRGFPPLAPGYEQPHHGDEDDEDPVPPASIAPGPRRRGARTTGSAGSRRRFSRVAWLAAAAVLVVAGGGYASYKYLYEARVNAPVPPTLRLPTNAPASPGYNPALGKWQHIGTRAQDPEPLTLQELFPPQFQLNGSSYIRTAADVSKNCSLAVFGSNLQSALQAGRCTQVLRASYISGDGTMMGTVGVANLSSSATAQKAGDVTGAQEIIAPLAAQKGPTSKLGNGTGVVQAEIKGHYLILMWAEFTNLKSPSTSAQRQRLEQFADNLLTGSANINLSTRMLTGKP